MGYRSESGRSRAQQIQRVEDNWHVYEAYPFLSISPKRTIRWMTNHTPDSGTLVNSVPHLKSYMTHHRLDLTKARVGA